MFMVQWLLKGSYREYFEDAAEICVERTITSQPYSCSHVKYSGHVESGMLDA